MPATFCSRSSNPRHSHEWTVFRDRKHEIPEDRILDSRCAVDTTTNFVEHPETVAQRLRRFVADLWARNGFSPAPTADSGPSPGYGAVDPDIAYAKLAALAEGAAQV